MCLQEKKNTSELLLLLKKFIKANNTNMPRISAGLNMKLRTVFTSVLCSCWLVNWDWAID